MRVIPLGCRPRQYAVGAAPEMIFKQRRGNYDFGSESLYCMYKITPFQLCGVHALAIKCIGRVSNDFVGVASRFFHPHRQNTGFFCR